MDYYELYKFEHYRKFKLEDRYFERLSDLCEKNGFIRKGKAFFRIHGDGVLQSLAFCYTSHFWHYSLQFNLLSMYSDYRLYDWVFSPAKNVFFHNICTLINHRSDIKLEDRGELPGRIWLAYPEKQLDILESKGFTFFNSVDTQEKLAKALCELDNVGTDAKKDYTIWNDWHKLAPFFSSKDYRNADKVICANLRQHIDFAYFQEKQIYTKPLPWTEEDINHYRPWFKESDAEFLEKHKWVVNADTEQIQEYLNANYARNAQKAKFCLRNKEKRG